MARPEDQDTALVSPFSQKMRFDSRKLGQLAFARRAISMESELERSSVWNLPPEMRIPRSISLDSRPSTINLNLNSLRKLGASPAKGDARRPSDGSVDECAKTAPSTKAPLKCSSIRRHEVLLVDTDVDTGCDGSLGVTSTRHEQAEKAHREAIPKAGSVVNATLFRPRTPLTTRASLRSGVDHKALAAVAELARRRHSDAASIVLPTNRPFLVGELASRILQQHTTPLSPVHTVCESTNPSSLVSTSHKETRKEGLDITILSKLLSFGGTLPHNASTFAQFTPEAFAPDVTMSPQSRSECSDGFQHSYLLQLGQIMGGVALNGPVHRPALDLDETAQSTSSTISSLEYSVAEKSDTSPRVRKNLCRFLFFMACFVSSWITLQYGEYVIGSLEATKIKLVPYKTEHYNRALRQMELLLEMAEWTEVYTQTVDWLQGNLVFEYVWIVVQKWHNFTQYTRQTLMIMTPMNTTPPIIPRAQVTLHVHWNLRSNISATLTETHTRAASSTTKSGPACLDSSLDVSSDEHTAGPTKEMPASGRERLEDKALAIITVETKRGVTSPPDETEAEESRLGRSPDDSSEERPAEPAYETPPPDSVKERLEDKAMAITTRDTSTDCSHGAHLASHSYTVPLKHQDSTSCLLVYQPSFWKSNRAGASFLSLDPRHEYAKLPSFFFSDTTLNQCHPSASANVCCESEFFETKKRVVVPRIDAALSAELEKDDGFLQIPLVDIVGQFLRERLKRRQKRGRGGH